MVHKCVVRDCKSEWYPDCNVSFHVFPKDATRRNKWLSILPLRKEFYEKAKICSRHFKSTDFKGNRLKQFAIPFYEDISKVTDMNKNTRNITESALAVDSPMKYIVIDATSSFKESSAMAIKSEPDDDERDDDEPSDDGVGRHKSSNEISLPFRDGCVMSVTSSAFPITNSSVPISAPEVIQEPCCTAQITAAWTPPIEKREYTDTCIQARLKTDRELKLMKEKKILIQKLKRQEKTIDHMKALLAVVKNYTANSEIENIIKGNFTEICNLFNKPDTTRNVRYCDEVKAFALNLHFYSPKAYDFIRKHMSLPHPETLRRISQPNESISDTVANAIEDASAQET